MRACVVSHIDEIISCPDCKTEEGRERGGGWSTAELCANVVRNASMLRISDARIGGEDPGVNTTVRLTMTFIHERALLCWEMSHFPMGRVCATGRLVCPPFRPPTVHPWAAFAKLLLPDEPESEPPPEPPEWDWAPPSGGTDVPGMFPNQADVIMWMLSAERSGNIRKHHHPSPIGEVWPLLRAVELGGPTTTFDAGGVVYGSRACGKTVSVIGMVATDLERQRRWVAAVEGGERAGTLVVVRSGNAEVWRTRATTFAPELRVSTRGKVVGGGADVHIINALCHKTLPARMASKRWYRIVIDDVGADALCRLNSPAFQTALADVEIARRWVVCNEDEFFHHSHAFLKVVGIPITHNHQADAVTRTTSAAAGGGDDSEVGASLTRRLLRDCCIRHGAAVPLGRVRTHVRLVTPDDAQRQQMYHVRGLVWRFWQRARPRVGAKSPISRLVAALFYRMLAGERLSDTAVALIEEASHDVTLRIPVAPPQTLSVAQASQHMRAEHSLDWLQTVANARGSCDVCLTDFDAASTHAVPMWNSTCGHGMCNTCWKKTSERCPFCRTTFRRERDLFRIDIGTSPPASASSAPPGGKFEYIRTLAEESKGGRAILVLTRFSSLARYTHSIVGGGILLTTDQRCDQRNRIVAKKRSRLEEEEQQPPPSPLVVCATLNLAQEVAALPVVIDHVVFMEPPSTPEDVEDALHSVRSCAQMHVHRLCATHTEVDLWLKGSFNDARLLQSADPRLPMCPEQSV